MPQTQHQGSLKPILDLQVYEPAKPARPKDQGIKVEPSFYLPMATNTPYFPPQYNPYWPNFQSQFLQPIIKTYNINALGPVADHTKISTVYEDVLPTKQFMNTMNTLSERLEINEFVRSVLIKQHDGEDINLDGKGQNSLLSYLKFMELNPYNEDPLTNNPYMSLPNDMLIYRSCYPIRYDDRSGEIQCSPNSIGMNIRIYRLSDIEYNIKNQPDKNSLKCNVWREVAYYEYIKEQIIRKKICPNFVMLYGYYISENSNIDFDKIARIKKTFNPITNPVGKDLVCTNKAIILLTEAPVYNIYGWSTKTYKPLGNVKKMVNTGFHSTKVWLSVLFQLMTAMYVMQIHNIIFDNFTVTDNVYIKDITRHENITNYWKYKIDGLEYYVPNYGYLVLIDSNYKDKKTENLLIKTGINNNYKIYGSIFGDVAVNKYAHDMFKQNISMNSFTKAFINHGGVPPPADIKKKLDDIMMATVADNSIGTYISKFMREFLNNRVGTYLTETEAKKVRKTEPPNFTKGQIVVHEIQSETYKFVIFLENLPTGKTSILTKNDSDENIMEDEISKGLLFNYSKADKVVQNYKPNDTNLNDDELLETYIINKN